MVGVLVVLLVMSFACFIADFICIRRGYKARLPFTQAGLALWILYVLVKLVIPLI